MFKVIVGPVKSEKSKVLIERYNSDKEHTLLLAPKIAQEEGKLIKSRYGTEANSVAITSVTEVIPKLNDEIRKGREIHTIMIDEIQFVNLLPDTLISVVDELAKNNITLIAYGLDMDYRGYPFTPTAVCMALADVVIKVHGYCDVCKKEDSTMSLRIDNGEVVGKKGYRQLIQLDGENNTEYLSVCRNCYNKMLNK